MIAPPTMTIEAPAFSASPTVSEFSPPATATGIDVDAVTAFNSWSGVGAIICSSIDTRSEEHTSELQSRLTLLCRLLLEKKKNKHKPLDGRVTDSGPSQWTMPVV